MPSSQQSDQPVDSGSLGFLVASVGQQAQAAFRLRLEPHGLHPRAYAVLSALVSGADHSQHDLSRLLGLPPSRIVGLVDTLEEQGLVKRRPHPLDGRAHLVQLTRAGRQKADDLRVEAVAVERELSTGLSEREREQLRELLLRVGANLGLGRDPGDRRIW